MAWEPAYQRGNERAQVHIELGYRQLLVSQVVASQAQKVNAAGYIEKCKHQLVTAAYKDASQLIEHPVRRGIEPLQVLLGPTRHRAKCPGAKCKLTAACQRESLDSQAKLAIALYSFRCLPDLLKRTRAKSQGSEGDEIVDRAARVQSLLAGTP